MASSAIRASGRVLGAVVAIGGAGALVLGATLLPATASSAPGTVVAPAGVDQQRVCPGPLLQLGDFESATRITSYGVPAVTAATIAGAPATVAALTDSDVETAADGAASAVLTAPSAADDSGLLSAAQAQVVRSGDAAGLAVVGCTEGTASSWIVAGATDTGRSSLLLLANPNGVAATVDLALYTGQGPVEAPGLQDLVIAPLSQRAISLAGYAPGQAQLAVEVRSRGGLVSATLQHTVVRGLEPGGVDLAGRTGAPATEQVVPGLRITTAAAAEARAHVGGSQDVETALRILAPRADADVTIGVVPETAGGVGTSLEVEAKAGRVVEVPFEGLADGTYTVTLTATEPVVAAARASTVAPPDPAQSGDEELPAEDAAEEGIGFDVVGPVTDVAVQAGERIDLAWFPSAGALTRPAAFAVADAPAPRLSVANTGEDAVTVTVEGGGVTQTLDLPARSTGVLDVAPNTVHLLTSTGAVAASVSYAGEGLLAAQPVRAANPLATPLTIYR
ncbi:DUF5719 family protein [Naasia sp. SYSU D00948]|uniref:DUF5719 family protein n=1 Tax=Naasia sp. SYSU D00948 TaxID=2817379 RepID=UPI001B3131C9|nr:DUF5719 family protein [Naasia sp. SYSU D00948]